MYAFVMTYFSTKFDHYLNCILKIQEFKASSFDYKVIMSLNITSNCFIIIRDHNLMTTPFIVCWPLSVYEIKKNLTENAEIEN